MAESGDLHRDLHDASCDFDEVRDDVREEGSPRLPSRLRGIRTGPHAIHGLPRRRFEAYPIPDGEIAINVPGGPACSVLLPYDSGDSALCSVNMDGKHLCACYSDTHRLSDGFVLEALAL